MGVANTAACQRVDARRLVVVRSVAAHLAGAVVIREDEDDVGPLRGGGRVSGGDEGKHSREDQRRSDFFHERARENLKVAESGAGPSRL